MNKTVADRIAHLHPCREAAEWARGYTSPTKAWRECERGDWMLWLLGQLAAGEPESQSRRKLVACAADCAALALPNWEAKYPNDRRVRDCIEACHAWSRGEITTEQLRAAARAASAAYAAYAAASAAYAAYAADDAYAADAAAYADHAAWAATLVRSADIVREHYPKPPTLEKARA